MPQLKWGMGALDFWQCGDFGFDRVVSVLGSGLLSARFAGLE